jgi:hypothetical protein
MIFPLAAFASRGSTRRAPTVVRPEVFAVELNDLYPDAAEPAVPPARALGPACADAADGVADACPALSACAGAEMKIPAMASDTPAAARRW